MARKFRTSMPLRILEFQAIHLRKLAHRIPRPRLCVVKRNKHAYTGCVAALLWKACLNNLLTISPIALSSFAL